MIKRFYERYQVYIWFLAALAPVLALRDFTPANELRYLSIASDALRDGNVFTFTNQGVPYADKPPLYLWIAMLAYRLFGTDCMWFMGLFSAIPAMIATELTLNMCGARIAEPRRNAARLTMLTAILFLALSFTVRMDMLMVMFIVAAIWEFMRIYRGEGNLRRSQWMVGVYVFLALFTKGPLGVAVPLLALAVFLFCERRLREFGRYWGWRCWAVLAAGCLLWWGLAYAEGGREYIYNLLFHQTVDRAVDAFHHKRPWWFYLVQVWWVMAPWCLLLAVQTGKRLYGRKQTAWSPEETMCMAVVLPTFILLSCISSKLAVYLLPISTFWIAQLFMTTDARGKTWQKWLVAGPAAVLCLAGIGIFTCDFMLFERLGISETRLDRWAAIGTGWALIWFMGLAVKQALQKKCLDGILTNMGRGILAAVFCAGFALPSFNHMLGLRAVALKGVEIQQEVKADRILTLGLKRSENIDVYFGEPVKSAKDAEELEAYLSLPGKALLICPRNQPLTQRGPKHSTLLAEQDDKSIYLIE